MSLRLGFGRPKSFGVVRGEKRIPMEVGLRISGHRDLPGIETTFTENVSARGARVLSSRRWRIDDRMTVATLTETFEGIARVAYCESIPNAGYVVGVEFVRQDGRWVIAATA
jgi:hypothetical protein